MNIKLHGGLARCPQVAQAGNGRVDGQPESRPKKLSMNSKVMHFHCISSRFEDMGCNRSLWGDLAFCR